MRLIDVDILLKEVNENKELFEKERVYLEGLLLNATTVEPYCYFCGQKEHGIRPQGEWEKPFLHSDGRWYHKCTNCHICSEVSILQDKYCNFCPNCGAKMKGGAE